MKKQIYYQILTRLWGDGRFSSFTPASLQFLKSFGVDTVWYTGIPRHASGGDFVKGDPGSPYAVHDWKDVNPYFVAPGEDALGGFDALVRRTHDAGLKVCIDYIPNHVSRDYRGPIPHYDWCDGDWTDTLKVDWTRPDTLKEMTEVVKFWARRGVDAFRCDMVELVDSGLLGRLIAEVKSEFPGVQFVAEVYGKQNYDRYLAAGFDFLYDKSGSYDILRAIFECGRSARELTGNWQWLAHRQERMLNFLENHDEQRLRHWTGGKPYWAAVAFSMLFNNAPYMIYFGQEAGEDAAEGAQGRTSIFNWSKPVHAGAIAAYAASGDIEALNEEEQAIFLRYKELLSHAHEDTFCCGRVWDLCYCQQQSGGGFNPDVHFAFLRYTPDGKARAVFCNFSPEKTTVRLTVPEEPGLLECGVRPCTLQISAAPRDFAIISLDNI